MAGGVGALGILLADGRLPTGGHAHSAGLEAAVRVGEVVDVDTLSRFALARLSTQGTVDAAFAATAARRWSQSGLRADVVVACGEDDRAAAIAELVDEFDARTPSPHLRDASRTLGRHLLRVAATLVDDPVPLQHHLHAAPRPIVAGAVVAELDLSPEFAAAVECHHLVSAICSGAVKLLGLDPLAIVAVQARLAERIDAISSSAAITTELSDLTGTTLTGTTSARCEVLAEWHAADTTRLFAT